MHKKKRLIAFLLASLLITPILVGAAPLSKKQKTIGISDDAKQKTTISEQASVNISMINVFDDLITTNQYWQSFTKQNIYTEGWTTARVNVREKPSKKSKILDTFVYNTKVMKIPENDKWFKIQYKDGIGYISSKYVSETENEPYVSPYADLIDSLTDYEKYLILQITYCEAGNQKIKGQRAVIEVILNRVMYEGNTFPDDVEGVLSQPNHFSTWPLRNREDKQHNEEQEKALQLVHDEEPILTKDYITFSRGQFSWADNYIQIGDHWFGTFKKEYK